MGSTNHLAPQDGTRTFTFRVGGGPWTDWEQHWQQARRLVQDMTLDEKLTLVSVAMALGKEPAGALGSAAHCAGVPRLGIPAWDESDASLGVTNPYGVRGADEMATAFPSTVALAATFDPDLARAAGVALGEEARQKGFSVLLAGGVNLVREPRGGRVFEYFSEDVLLSGLMAGAAVAGIQSQGVVSTLKHFVLNPQETGRVMISSDLSEPHLRQSDLLAFEIAVEHGQPRAVMTAYNMVNRTYAAEHGFLLHEVLKGDWQFKGFVMSDWGGAHSTGHSARAGLDRQSAYELDTAHYFGDALAHAVEARQVPAERLDEMVVRIVAALDSVGALGERRRPTAPSYEAHGRVAAQVAQRSVVLLQNEGGLLPLAATGGRLAVLGPGAAVGVLSGGGSSTVTPPGSVTEEGWGIPQMPFPKVHHPPSPLAALVSAFPQREVVHLGMDASGLRPDDVAVVIAEKWATEGLDAADLRLGEGQDELIAMAAGTAAYTVVALTTAGPVLMPWRGRVDAVLAAWYGGSHGAAAVAAVLAGTTCPSGRLPLSFPAAEADLPRPEMLDPATTTSNPGMPRLGPYVSIDYDIEGADVGYRWFARTGHRPLYPFGYGLSYTQFSYADMAVTVRDGGYLSATVTVTNTGVRAGAEVVQVYVAPPPSERSSGTFRLAGFARLALEPGQQQRVRLVLDDERLLATYDPDGASWIRPAGVYRVCIARHADVSEQCEFEHNIELPERRWGY